MDLEFQAKMTADKTSKLREKLLKVGQQLDLSNDGSLDLEELEAVFDSDMGGIQHLFTTLKITRTDLEALCELADVNGDGKVDYQEFVDAVMGLASMEEKTLLLCIKQDVSRLKRAVWEKLAVNECVHGNRKSMQSVKSASRGSELQSPPCPSVSAAPPERAQMPVFKKGYSVEFHDFDGTEAQTLPPSTPVTTSRISWQQLSSPDTDSECKQVPSDSECRPASNSFSSSSREIAGLELANDDEAQRPNPVIIMPPLGPSQRSPRSELPRLADCRTEPYYGYLNTGPAKCFCNNHNL